MPPDADPALQEMLLKYFPSGIDTRTKLWHTTVIDAGDGSGDGLLPLPDELLAHIGWKEGDTLSVIQDESGKRRKHRDELEDLARNQDRIVLPNEDRMWLEVAPLGREWGSPDYENYKQNFVL